MKTESWLLFRTGTLLSPVRKEGAGRIMQMLDFDFASGANTSSNIGEKWVEGSQKLAVINPMTAEPLLGPKIFRHVTAVLSHFLCRLVCR